MVALIKPKFEVGPAFVGKGGLVRDVAAIGRQDAAAFLAAFSWTVTGEAESPIYGGDGNAEFLDRRAQARASSPLVRAAGPVETAPTAEVRRYT